MSLVCLWNRNQTKCEGKMIVSKGTKLVDEFGERVQFTSSSVLNCWCLLPEGLVETDCSNPPLRLNDPADLEWGLRLAFQSLPGAAATADPGCQLEKPSWPHYTMIKEPDFYFKDMRKQWMILRTE